MSLARAHTHSVGNAGNGGYAGHAGTVPRRTTVTTLPDTTTVPIVTTVTAVTGVTRWHLLCRLLRSPERESRRLARLLERWPATRRRHSILDDARKVRGCESFAFGSLQKACHAGDSDPGIALAPGLP